MLRAAHRGAATIADAAGVVRFLRHAACPDGGFRGRADDGDLYYTVFALQSLAALAAAPDDAALARFLARFDGGDSLDFIHAACLARCWVLASPAGAPPAVRRSLAAHIETFRSADGGYHASPGSPRGTAYGCFLALGAAEDLAADLPDASGLARCLDSLRTADGGYANEPAAAVASTPATAAAVTVLAVLGWPVPPETIAWLRARARPSGGFLAAPQAPIPDLLSTATALHALAVAGAPPLDSSAQAACGEFVRGLQASDGGFRGHWADDACDIEYTFYGLLALGHLGTRP